MEALLERVRPGACLLIAVSLSWLTPQLAIGAAYRTTNFTISAPTPQMAKQIGDTAEHWRRELAQQWLGQELPNWQEACPITARVSPQLGAGGETSFIFDQGLVFGWRMNVQGSLERVLDSVLPHEITHTIFASYFRRPLPRWADEGACTTVEHPSEITKQENNLIEYLQTDRGISFSTMFALKEYPQDVLPLYAQGHSLAKFLIAQRGKRHFLKFLGEGMQDENWPRAIHQSYGYRNLLNLQNDWMHWIQQGRPEIQPFEDSSYVSNSPMPPVVSNGVQNLDPVRDASKPTDLMAGGPSRTAPVPSTSTLVTEPWTSVKAPQDPAQSQLASSTLTWPDSPDHQSMGRNPGSIYDAARNRGTMTR